MMAQTPCRRRSLSHQCSKHTAPGPSPWEPVLPGQLLALPEELARADELLDDPVFLRAVPPLLPPPGGPQVGADGNFLAEDVPEVPPPPRLAEPLPEVAGSTSWHRFCRLPLFSHVPGHST
jgi:hypothetical protein